MPERIAIELTLNGRKLSTEVAPALLLAGLDHVMVLVGCMLERRISFPLR